MFIKWEKGGTILAMAIFIAIPFVAFYLGMCYEKKINTDTQYEDRME